MATTVFCSIVILLLGLLFDFVLVLLNVLVSCGNLRVQILENVFLRSFFDHYFLKVEWVKLIVSHRFVPDIHIFCHRHGEVALIFLLREFHLGC